MDALTVPFGVSSSARKLPLLDGKGFTVSRSHGARLIDTEGNSFVDYGMAMGATLIGHGHPDVMEACVKALHNGPMPGFSNDIEELAGKALVRIGGERVTRATFATTGTEAVHLACRIARAATGRRLIAKAVGGYDGWFDPIRFGLVESTEAERTNERPVKEGTTLFRVNEVDDIDQLFDEMGDDLAAILVEPMLGNTGCLVPERAFFEHLSKRAQENGTLIIADEVMVGLRRGVKLVSEELGLTPDLVTLGKAIGSGVPVAAVLGTPKAFEVVENGTVPCFGTYHGNPLVASAVLATMKLLEDESHYTRLFDWGAALRRAAVEAFTAEGITTITTGFDSVFSLWFTDRMPRNYDEARTKVRPEATRLVSDTLRRHGVVGLPSPWGRYFISFAHGDSEMEVTVQAFRAAARALAASGFKG
ncbi:aminotransferase class III-fold pyridoxal phosphate-dependent enzyme [Ancylobacter sonchi]|uniref:aminotransferase class III-fold pyridoxal phosphate-dependent enzyme n=1 Tax=Ancylobacter sonchi TaxID=1937790 RepID=UPI001BD2295A|nr:aminotransferase class III-fold pyridoxal phosphate-dependent enzyme [Ancylobacter sonchi]MBS7534012.1 aminotransferase class III-fold pyridoxal phosphate-dependent enzyme [Ancylobacter sonchi]